MYRNFKSVVMPEESWKEFLKGIKREDMVYIVGTTKYTQSFSSMAKVITKGPKFITVDFLNAEIKFNSTTGNQVTSYSASYEVYPSKETYEAMAEELKEFNNCLSRVKKVLEYPSNITLESMKTILGELEQ